VNVSQLRLRSEKFDNDDDDDDDDDNGDDDDDDDDDNNNNNNSIALHSIIQFTVSRVKLDMSNSVYNPYLDSKNAQYINKVQYDIYNTLS